MVTERNIETKASWADKAYMSMSISPLFSGKSEAVESLSMASSLSSVHQSLNVSSPIASPITGTSGSVGLSLPSMGNERTTNFYSSPSDLFLGDGPVDGFKIPTGNGTSNLGMQDDELGSLYDFKRDNNSQQPYSLSTSPPNTSHIFSQAILGSRLLAAESDDGKARLRFAEKSKYVLGPSAAKEKKGRAKNAGNQSDQEHTILAKKMFAGHREDQPTIDAELAAIGIKGIPTIHTACVDGNLKLVRRLTELRDADVEAEDILGSRPMHVASCYGHLDIICFLLENGADVNAVDNYKSTPLVVTSHPETVKLLVSFGADINAKNVNNISAKSISLSNPYVCLSIEQGLKQLQERISMTKRFLIQARSDFGNEDICKYWLEESKEGNDTSNEKAQLENPSKKVKLEDIKNLTTEESTPLAILTGSSSSGLKPMESSEAGAGEQRKRKLSNGTPAVSGNAEKDTPSNGEKADMKRGEEYEQGPFSRKGSMNTENGEVGGEPSCIADLIISMLYTDQFSDDSRKRKFSQ